MTNPLWRIYFSNEDGECTTTVALVWAKNDSEAIEQVKHLCGDEQVTRWAEEQGLDREDAFVTAECIEDRERLEHAVEDFPGLVAGGPVAVAAVIEAFAHLAGLPKVERCESCGDETHPADRPFKSSTICWDCHRDEFGD